MGKGFLTSSLGADDFGISPPILPGDYIVYSGSFCTLFPVMDASDPSKIDHWGVGSIEGDNKQSASIAKGDERWASSLVTLTDPSKGKEVGCILGSKSIYLITRENAAPPSFQAVPRTDPDKDRDTLNGAFFSTFLTDHSDSLNQVGQAGAITLEPKHRLIYALLSGKDSQVRLYDALDASANLTLDFKQSNILGFHHAFSFPTKKSYTWCFVLSIQGKQAKTPSMGLYLISNTALVKAFRQKSTLDETAFIEYPISPSFLLSDITAAPLYFDKDNAGSYQLALYIRNEAGWALQILTFKADNTLTLINQIIQKSTAPILKLDYRANFQSGLLRHISAPSGESLFILAYEGMEVLKKQSPAHPTDSVSYRSSRLDHILLSFDSKEKKLAVSSSKRVYFSDPVQFATLEAEATNPGDQTTPSLRADRFISNFPALLYPGFALQFEITEDEKQVHAKLTKMSVFYRMIHSTWDSSMPEPKINNLYEPILFHAHALDITTLADGSYQFKDLNDEYITPSFSSDPDHEAVFETNSESVKDDLNFDNRLWQGYLSSSVIDFEGHSIMVGSPHITYNDKSIQVMGIYRCLPFDAKVQQTLPTLSISTSHGVMTGVSKSTSSSWHAGYGASGGYSGAFGSVNAHYNKNWGGSKLDMESDQKTISIHVTTGNARYDVLHAYGSSFYLWEYPLFQTAKQTDPFGYLSILIPDGFVDSSLDTTDSRLAYDQDYEIGKILTYLESEKPGYKVENLWFNKESVTCTSDSQGGGSSVVYSEQNSTHKETQKTTDDGFNAGGSVSLGFAGFSASVNGYYTSNNVKNSATTTVRTDELTITAHTGVIKEAGYEYVITPLIYTHEHNNLLLICSNLELTGPLWKSLYQSAEIIMMRVFPFAEDLKLNAFSRSIRFTENKDKSTNIDLHLFSNSFAAAHEIVCKVYTGMAIYVKGKPPDLSGCKLIGTLTHPQMEGLKREVLTLANQKLSPNTTITVEVFHDDLEKVNQSYYWGVYPYSAFNKNQLTAGDSGK